MVFSELASEDGINNELLDFEDIAMRFNGMGHPEVIARRMTTKQALQLFLDSFVGGTEVDGKVTMKEFVNYYTNVGAAIDNDSYFDLLVRNVWGVADINNDNSNGKGYSESKERDSRNKSLRNGGVKSNGSIASSVSGSKQTPPLSGSAGQQGLRSQQRQRPMSAAATRIQRPMPGIASSSSSQQPSLTVPVRPASAYNPRPTNSSSNNNQPPMFTQSKSTPTPTPPIKVVTLCYHTCPPHTFFRISSNTHYQPPHHPGPCGHSWQSFGRCPPGRLGLLDRRNQNFVKGQRYLIAAHPINTYQYTLSTHPSVTL